MRLIGLPVQKPAGTSGQRLNNTIGNQNPADRLITAAETLGDDLDVRGDPLLLPGVHGAGAAHAAHHLIQDQQRAMAVANLPHAPEIARDRGDATGRRADHRFGQERDDRVGTDTLELRLQLVRQVVPDTQRRSRRHT